MRLYAALLGRIYPGKKIRGHILWTHDWTIEEINNEP
jgi:hypothetical protein